MFGVNNYDERNSKSLTDSCIDNLLNLKTFIDFYLHVSKLQNVDERIYSYIQTAQTK